MQRGPQEELDLGSSDDDDEPLLPSKLKRKGKLKPSDGDSSAEEDSEEDSDEERITAANMEARTRALDEQAALDAEIDAEELRNAAAAIGDDDSEMDEAGDGDGDGLQLPTAEEREEEKKTGASDLGLVMRRLQHCARVLNNFKKLGAKDRFVLFRPASPTFFQLMRCLLHL